MADVLPRGAMNPAGRGATTAFVLAGGGSLGAVQAGMLVELLASGEVPDFVVGISAGAINGAFLAWDPSPGMTERMATLWSTIRTRDVMRWSWRLPLGLLGAIDHLAGSAPLRSFLARELPYRRLEDARVPLFVVAADQRTGEEVVLRQGDLVDSVCASAAIPGVFPPVELDGRRLVDGAVSSATPIAAAIRLGAQRIVVLPCGFTCVDAAVPRHPLGRAMHAITLIGARRLRQDWEYHRDRARLCIVPPLCPLTCSAYDYSRGAELVRLARQSTRRWLDAAGLDSPDFPHELEEHQH